MRCKRCDCITNAEYCRACTKKVYPGKRNAKRRAIRVALERIVTANSAHNRLGVGYYGGDGVKAPALRKKWGPYA